MKKLSKSLLVFILGRLVDLIYFPPLFNFNHSPARKKAIKHFLQESNLPVQKTIPELVRSSVQYYRMFKSLNMYLLLAGVYIKDIEIFYQTLGDVQVSGLDILEQNRDKSVIGLSYHIGPFSMIPVILALKGYNSIVLLRSDTLEEQAKMSLERINEGMDYLARTYNVGRVQFVDSLETLSLVLVRKSMKEGDILMLYPDTAKESSVSSMPVDFFTTRIAGHIGVVKLCRFTRATVIPMAARWDEQKKIHLTVEKPLDIDPDGTEEEIVRGFYELFEKRVAAVPEQWIQVESYEKLKY